MQGVRPYSFAHHLTISSVDVPRIAVKRASNVAETHLFMVTEIGYKCLERCMRTILEEGEWYPNTMILGRLVHGFLARFPQGVCDCRVRSVEEIGHCAQLSPLFIHEMLTKRFENA